MDRFFIAARAFVVVVAAVIVTLLALPSPMRSAAWTPPRAPNLEGPFARNDALERVDRLAAGQVVGPECVAIDGAGRIYTGTTDGKIVRVLPGVSVEVFTETGGRPLGMAFVPSPSGGTGDLIVADVMKGLLRVDTEGNIEVLTRKVEGTPIVFANSVAVAHDGHTVYFTDSSSKWGYGDQVNDILESIPTGRLVRYDLATHTADALVHGLAFANGVALAPDDSYALVTETSRYRVTRVWLTGNRRNIAETLVDNLPGFPDDISLSPRGTFWVALYSVRKPLLDDIHPFPFVKDCVAGLPESLRPQPTPYGLVFEMDASGRVLRSFHDPDGERCRDLTSVVESRGVLYLGSLTGTSIGRFSP